MIYLQLFWTFFRIGAVSFGGGYSIVALIQQDVVERFNWITAAQFADIVAVSQMTPGPIAINSATYIGYTTTGNVWGSALATLGVTAPSLILMTIASLFFFKLQHNAYITHVMRALRPIVIGLILSAVLALSNSSNFTDVWSGLIAAGAFAAALKNVNVVYIFIVSGAIGYILYGL